MNKERLEMLAAHLEKLPKEQFDMSRWGGVSCCIGGHAERLFECSEAGEYLSLTWEQQDALFWPDGYDDARELSPTPQQAASVVRHLKDAGKVEWERFVNG